MSLLLEALKKAEKAKEEAQKRAQEGEPTASGELTLAEDTPATPGDEKRVVTRDELPPITSPLEIQSEDLRATGAAGGGAQSLDFQTSARPAQDAPARAASEPPAAQRAAARKPFEAKVREPNPRLPFYITMGALGVACIGTVIYFWIQLSSPPSIYVKNPKPPSDERPVEVAQPAAPVAPGASATAPGAIPGLPPAPQTPVQAPAQAAAGPSVAPTPATTPAPAPKVAAAPPAAPRVERRPVTRAPRARPAPAAAAVRPAVTHNRPGPRIHPLVSSGYAAYQAGDMARARLDYEAALRDEPDNRDALLGLAAVETHDKRYPEADALYRRVLDIDPRDAHAQAGLVGLRAGQVDPVSTESKLKGLIASDASESVLYYSLGNQFAQQGRWAEAGQAYARAVAMDADNPDYAFNYAVSLEHGRQPEAALTQYRRALSLGLKRTASFDPGAAEARVQALSR